MSELTSTDSETTILAQQQTTAFNYAEHSDNRIHADDVAQQFGFRGGLVPGVGDYAYMARAAQQALGDAWLDSGWMEAKFVRPVYHGDRVTAQAIEDAADVAELQLLDSAGTLCGIGRAGTSALPFGDFEGNEVPPAAAPSRSERPTVSLDVLRVGGVLGSLHRTAEEVEAMWRGEPDRYADVLPERASAAAAGARLHPAYVPELGNDLLVANVELGPWIHTGSAVRHRSPLRPDLPLEVRGTVGSARSRKGRDEVELQIAILQNGRCAAQMLHRAIVRLPSPATPGRRQDSGGAAQ